MRLDTLASPFARIHYACSKRRERQMGYRLILNNLSPHWIDSTMIFDMASVWSRFGLTAIGVNYFTIGSVKSGLSTRYDATSPYYQSWLGGYIVQFPKHRAWTLDDHFALGVADQKSWLKLYGVRYPEVRVEKSSVKGKVAITVSGYKGKLYEGNILSNTDVGNNKPLALPFMMAGMGALFHFDNPKINIVSQNFIPHWSANQPLNPFQTILLKGYLALFPLSPTTTALFYANGCEFTDKTGKHYDHFSTIKDELQGLMKKMSIVKLV